VWSNLKDSICFTNSKANASLQINGLLSNVSYLTFTFKICDYLKYFQALLISWS
jgi:hypothetical protein